MANCRLNQHRLLAWSFPILPNELEIIIIINCDDVVHSKSHNVFADPTEEEPMSLTNATVDTIELGAASLAMSAEH